MGAQAIPVGIDRDQLLARADALCRDDAGRADPASIAVDAIAIGPDGRGRLDLRFVEVVNHACRGIEERSNRRERLDCTRRGQQIELDAVIDWRGAVD